MFQRIHMARTASPLRHAVTYLQQKYALKPAGLWYGIDHAWLEWCACEEVAWQTPYLWRVHINVTQTRLLVVDRPEMVDLVTQQWGKTPGYWQAMQSLRHRIPDWEAVAQDYDGIEFHPYLYSRRFAYLWYNGIDVASGCVWNLGRVEWEPYCITEEK